MTTTIPLEGYAFLDALAVGEDYHFGDYNELVGGDTFSGYDTFPDWEGKQFPGGISHAAGRYQFEPATWRAQAGKLGLPDFSPASQDVAAWDLACAVYQRRTGRDFWLDLRSKGASGRLMVLQSTWTSISARTWDRYCGALSARLQPLGATD